MKSQIHILNGDALLHQFPEATQGERIVMRECLVTGPVLPEGAEAVPFGGSLEELSPSFCCDLNFFS